MPLRLASSLEPLESRIAPAGLTILHPLPDIVVGAGLKSEVIDLNTLFDATASDRSHVEFLTNFDTDPATPGLQAGRIVIELFDDKTPYSVQNFLNYVESQAARSDYDGVVFHRSVDSPSDTQNLQILQAGGFEASRPPAHVPVSGTVHNEYDANDPELQNTLGTIAMAKTNLGPNTGTSEFFFNMGDNSQTLGGTNNGGYTVFGKVTEGLSVLQAIFAQPKIDVSSATKNSALTDVPYQGSYNSNPDNNDLTPAPALKSSNYITITSAKLIAPGAPADVPQVSYSVQVDGDGVFSKLNGDKLTLTYGKGGSGTARVTVHAQHPVLDGVDDSFEVTTAPNLVLTSAGDTLEQLFAAGDAGLGKVKFSNNGGALLEGTYEVKFYLSQTTASDPQGNILDSSDILVGSGSATLKLRSGESATIAAPLQLPVGLVSGNPTFRLIAYAEPDSAEAFADDNLMIDGALHQAGNLFGTYVFDNEPTREHPSLTYLDADGHHVTATLKGPGFGVVTQTSDGINVDVYGSTARTSLTFASFEGGTVDLHSVFIRGVADEGAPIGSVNLAEVSLSGNFEASGGVKSLTLGGVQETGGEHFLTLGANSFSPTLRIGDLNDTTIVSLQAIKSLVASKWVNDNSAGLSSFAGLKSLLVENDLQADVNIAGTAASFIVRGELSDSHITAAKFETIKLLGTVDTASGTGTFGFTADAIKSYGRTGISTLKNLTSGTFDSVGNYAVTVI